MGNSALTKLGIVILVLVAFVDGMLVAQRLEEKRQGTEASELQLLEDVFKEPVGIETVETPVEEEKAEPQKTIPFTSQAPYGNWDAPWSDYAEEAVLTMAMGWVHGENTLSREDAYETMLAIGTWEGEQWGHSKATDLAQTLRILKEYFAHPNVELSTQITVESFIAALKDGAVLILPVNGQLLQNPHYGDPAPKNHMILVTAYDPENNRFLAHDPGTLHGENTAYEPEKLLNAVQDLDGSRAAILIRP